MSGDSRRKSLREIQDVVAGLRADVDAPDLSHAILSRVHAERPFLGRRPRRWLAPVRLACLGACLAVVLGIVLIQRHQPEATVWAGGPMVLTTVVGCVECEAEKLKKMQQFRLAVAGMTQRQDAGGFQPTDGLRPAASPMGAAAERSGGGHYRTHTIAAGDVGGMGGMGDDQRPALLGSSGTVAGVTGSDRFDDGAGFVRVSWSGPPARGNRRNLLRDLGPLLTGQPAGEWMSPK